MVQETTVLMREWRQWLENEATIPVALSDASTGMSSTASNPLIPLNNALQTSPNPPKARQRRRH